MSVGSISVRTRLSGDTTFLDLTISHPMENGMRQDGAGTTIPSWYMTDLEVFHNDDRVAVMALGPLVSRNPAVSIALNDVIEGDELKVTWADNRGEAGEGSRTV